MNEPRIGTARLARAPRTPPKHGNSPAAWTCVGIMTLGVLVCAASFPLTNALVFWGGVVVIGIGLAVGKVMSLAGFGSMPSYNVQEPNPTVLEGPTLNSPEDD